MSECKHPIFSYLGGQYREDGSWGQLHRCIDCGHEEIDVPKGSMMLGHAPGECEYCDEAAKTFPPEQKDRWVRLNKERRGEL